MKGRILLVEPSPELANNLKVLVSRIKGFQIVGQSASGLQAMRMMSALFPDVLILDLSLPDMIALDVARWAERLFPRTNVVLLSTYDVPEYRTAATRLKRSAFISKAELWRELPHVLRSARRERLVRERERGGILLNKCCRQLRRLVFSTEKASRMRDQAPVWALIHMGMAALCLEFIAAFLLREEVAPRLAVAGWSILLTALIHDLFTLHWSVRTRFTFAVGGRVHG